MMAEEFENTSQNTQADVKAAGTMLAAPFEIARQATLEEVQQTGVATQEKVAEVSGKIGNYGDTSAEETLFGESKNLDEKVTALAGKTDGIGEYGLDVLFNHKLDFGPLVEPNFLLEENVLYAKKVGQFICTKSGRLNIQASLTFRVKTNDSLNDYFGLVFDRNIKSSAELDIGAIKNAYASYAFVDSTYPDTSGEWSEPKTISATKTQFDVRKGEIFTIFVGAQMRDSRLLATEIIDATLEFYALE